MADRILARVAARETADAIRAIHLSEGVHIHERTGLIRLIGGDEDRVKAAELSDGRVIDTDMVIVGIGVTPNDQLAADAGLEVQNGIVVDAYGQTTDPAIHAVGDCTVQDWNGHKVRLESVQNAVDQAEAVAAILAGGTEPYRPRPWFWSDQYEVKLQIAGFNLGYDDTVLRPGVREGSLSVWYFRQGDFIAVDAINDAKAYVTGKKLLEMGRPLNRNVIADSSLDLKSLIA
jgi:3-phenylpropionate/trans-cinnamate dioxygenase ferredoxin reductase component